MRSARVSFALAAATLSLAACPGSDFEATPLPDEPSTTTTGPSATATGQSATTVSSSATGGEGGASSSTSGGGGASTSSASGGGAGGASAACDEPCDDGLVCNGLESCDTTTGLCVPGVPIECDDGDICNGVETCEEPSGTCITPAAPSCPSAPDACGQMGGVGSATAGEVTAASAAGFRLTDTDEWAANDAIIQQLAAHPSVTPTSFETILDTSLNRSGSAISVSGLGCFHDGFEWDSSDGSVEFWWPQGVTGSTGAYDNVIDKGKLKGRRVMLVSWYHKAEEDPGSSVYKGVRVSLTDVTSTSSVNYRHILLVQPKMDGATPTYKALASATSSLHAGGLAWVGPYLYVASTSSGFRVFDTRLVFEVATGDASLLGYQSSTDEYHAYNYRYIMPQVGAYTLCETTCCARFSFVSLDTSTTPKSLLAGEYASSEPNARVHRWPIDEQTSRLLVASGGVQSSEVVFPGADYIQGALSYNGFYFLSTSRPKVGLKSSFGSFYDGKLGGSLTAHRYPYLPEDLYFAKYDNELWTCTESPNSLLGQTRYCFSFLRSDVLNGCD